MNRTIIIKPWITYFKAFPMLFVFFFSTAIIKAQNTLEEQHSAEGITNLIIKGDDIFRIKVNTSKSAIITIKSIVDGEYENNYRIKSEIALGTLSISINQLPFLDIVDDKRNAHKVIAATLLVEIPKALNLSINSDIGSVEVNGVFNNVTIQLNRGSCRFNGNVKSAIINTLDGDINVATTAAAIDAESNNGNVTIADFVLANANWFIKTINGDITVVKQE